MYPVDIETSGAPVMYSTDNPLHDDPPLHPKPENRASAYPSTYGALADVAAADPPPGSGGFPMVVYSHGNTYNGLQTLEDAHEILTSHGFVVVLLDHTADVFRSFFAPNPDLVNDAGCKLDGIKGVVACRAPDIPLAIDVMLERNEDPADLLYGAINPDAIGVEGFSRGFGAILATTVGMDELDLVDSGILPDFRVKALFAADGNLKGVTEESLRDVNVPVFAFMGKFFDNGAVRKQIQAATSLLLLAKTPAADKMGSWIDGPHVSIAGDICALPTRVLDAVEAGTATYFDTFEMKQRDDLRNAVLEHCPASVFEGHLDDDICSLGFVPDEIPEDMPTGIPNSEIFRLKTSYLVAFFERFLAGDDYYAQFLTQDHADQNDPAHPLWCRRLPDAGAACGTSWNRGPRHARRAPAPWWLRGRRSIRSRSGCSAGKRYD